MIPAILFDFGGVLGPETDNWQGNFQAICQATKLSPGAVEEIFNRHWEKLKLGKEPTIAFWQEVVGKSSNQVAAEDLEKIYTSQITIYPEMVKLVTSLKSSGLTLYLLTNEAKEWMDIKTKKLSLANYFEKAYCSAYLGLAKPDPKIFASVLKDLALPAQSLLFIDNQEDYIAAAQKLGLNGIVYQNPNQLKTDLKRYEAL